MKNTVFFIHLCIKALFNLFLITSNQNISLQSLTIILQRRYFDLKHVLTSSDFSNFFLFEIFYMFINFQFNWSRVLTNIRCIKTTINFVYYDNILLEVQRLSWRTRNLCKLTDARNSLLDEWVLFVADTLE